MLREFYPEFEVIRNKDLCTHCKICENVLKSIHYLIMMHYEHLVAYINVTMKKRKS